MTSSSTVGGKQANGASQPRSRGSLRVSMVVAAARNGVIGRGGNLPWSIPSDLKTFRRLTLNKPIIMGRKTFQSIGRALDKRDNIVVTRQAGFSAPGVHVVNSVASGFALADTFARARGADETVIIGGAEIYAAAYGDANRIYLTIVDAEPVGDATFAWPTPEDWTLVRVEPIVPDPRDEFSALLKVFDRKAAKSAK